MKKNVLITGATGNIGNLLMNRLVCDDHNVLGLSLNGNNNDINAVDLLKITDDEITAILKNNKIDTIIHLAADIKTDSLDGFILNSFILNKFFNNELGKKIKYIVLSSASEYGDSDTKILRENISKLSPLSNYGNSKLLQTTLCFYYHETRKIDVTVIRLFNIFAPFLPKTSIIGSLIDKAKNKTDRKILINNLNIKRDFIDLRDFVDLISILIVSKSKEVVYNVGSGSNISYSELISGFNRILQKNGLNKITVDVSGKNETINNFLADVSKIKKDYKWKPKYSFDNSIEWCLKENKVI